MALVALLFAHHVASGGGEPLAVTDVAGLSVLERQAMLARRLGAERVFVVAERMPPGLAAALLRVRDLVEVVREPARLATGIAEGDRVLTLEEGLVVDAAAAEALLESESDTLLAVKAGEPPYPEAERLDSSCFWAGLAVYDGRLVRRVVADLGEWDLQSTLLRAATGEGVRQVEAFAPTPPAVWAPAVTDETAAAIGERLIGAGREVRWSWPARFLYAPLERWLLGLVLPTRISGPALAAAGVGMGLLAAIAFALGWLWPGLVLAILAPPVADTGLWLARARLAPAPAWLDPLFDYGVEPAWYLGLAASLAAGDLGWGAWVLAAAIIAFRLAADAQRSFFGRVRGEPLETAGVPEMRLARAAAARETMPWLLLPFAAAGAWPLGLVALGLYTAGSFFGWQSRLFARLDDKTGIRL
jgi:hypothetical protein